MKRCGYCGRENEDTAAYCSECGTDRFAGTSPSPVPRAPHGPTWRAYDSRTSPWRAVLLTVLGVTLLVVIFGAVFGDWVYFDRWMFGLAALGLAGGYLFIKEWLKRRIIHIAEQQITYDEPPSGKPEA